MDLQTVSTIIGIIIGTTGFVAGIIQYIMSSRKADRTRNITLETRQAQLFMQIYNRWTSLEYSKAYLETRHIYGSQWNTIEDYQKLMGRWNLKEDLETAGRHQSLYTFFEGIGMLVKRKLVDIDLVEDLFAGRIIWYWEKFGEWIKFDRKQSNDPQYGDSIEYLYYEMKKRQQQTITPRN